VIDISQAAKSCPWVPGVGLGHSRLRWAHHRRRSGRARVLEMDLVLESSPSQVRLPDDPMISGRPQPKNQDLRGHEGYRLIRNCHRARSHTHDVDGPRLWRRDISLEFA